MKKSSMGRQAEQGLEKLFGADGCISGCACDSVTAGYYDGRAAKSRLAGRRGLYGGIQG